MKAGCQDIHEPIRESASSVNLGPYDVVYTFICYLRRFDYLALSCLRLFDLMLRITQWIRLRLPCYCPGFESQTHNYAFLIYCQSCALCMPLHCEKKENKQKEAKLGTYLKESASDLLNFL